MIKVKWLKAHFRYAYSKGDVGFVTPEAAEGLLQGGYIMLIPEAEKYDQPIPEGEKINSLPKDLPGRDKLFAAGFDSIEKIKSVANGDGLLDVVSNAMVKKVKKYLKENPA